MTTHSSVSDRREHCYDALGKANFEGGDPMQALWPNLDYLARSDQHTAVANAQQALTRYVWSLRDRIDQESELWSYDPVGQHEFPDGATLAVTLEAVKQWRAAEYCHNDEGVIQNVHLPRTYTHELLRLTDRIAKEKGLIDDEPPVADE